MLSICIPTYAESVTTLVHALHQQAAACAIPFEILVWDDASGDAASQLENDSLNRLSGVQFRVLPKNLGRAAIRNALGQAAKYTWLLFMDGDSGVCRADFIAKYLAAAQQEAVYCGGTAYTKQAPTERALKLRWHYGRLREAAPPAARQSFTSHHFLIPKALFVKYPFTTQLKGYGHEDTVFGYTLKQANIRIIHLDNPLLHLGLEPATHFLKKTRRAIENLKRLEANPKYAHALQESKLWRLYARTRGAAPFGRLLFRVFRRGLEYQLTSARPSLRLFDLYKLGYLYSL